MVVFVSPRLAVIEQISVLSMTWNAARRAPAVPASCARTMNDTPAARLLRHRQRMLRMRFQPGVIDTLDSRLRFEPGGQRERPIALRAHADGQRLEPFQD